MRFCWMAVVAILACRSTDPKLEQAKSPLSSAPASSPAANQSVRIGQVKRAPTDVMFAVIAPAGANLASLETLAKEQAAAAKLTIELARLSLGELDITRERAEYMFGGVAAAQFDAIERGSALVLVAEQPKGIAGLRALASVAAAVAKEARGWVVDPGVGGLFTAEAFAARVPGQALDIRKLIVVHGVSGAEEEPFLDTMGMNRLGFPELYVRAAAPAHIDALTSLINATAQTLVTRGDISRPGELDVDLAKLDASWHLDEIKQAGGTGRITWRVRWTQLEGHGDGDAADRDLHLELLPMKGEDITAIAATLDTFFGDAPDPVAHLPAADPELLAAGERARKDLEGMRRQFAKGVPPGEQLAVKAPFTADDGTVEWMWVDVIKWRGNELSGVLGNEPDIVTSLKIGSRVTVELSDVADYIHVQRDGTQKGGYSVEVMRKRGLIP